IGYDKINQLRHARFFGDKDGIINHMKKHAAIIKPKFDCVCDILEKEIAPLEIGSWFKPKGGYFISFDSLPGCAKRIYDLCKNAGITLTTVGATFPYGNDPLDQNIRIAPTFPPVSELETAMNIFCLCTKISTAEMLLSK
ncbi:MAG: aminotransferase, partial [Oscillospiraceae bacterium]